jgi:hypothetical protein
MDREFQVRIASSLLQQLNHKTKRKKKALALACNCSLPQVRAEPWYVVGRLQLRGCFRRLGLQENGTRKESQQLTDRAANMNGSY